MPPEPLPEVREPDAPLAVTAIYRDIREATGLPFVNLAWRHMAALPGILPWVWAMVGAEYRCGGVRQAAARLRDAAAQAAVLEPLRPADLETAGLSADAQRVLADLLEAYNRGNSQNLIGWSAVIHRLSGDVGPAEARPGGDEPALAPLPALPALPRLADSAPSARRAVEHLARRHRSFPAGAVPSLYLHLAHWPALPALIDRRLESGLPAESWSETASRLSAVAEAAAGKLAPRLPCPREAPPPEARAALARRLEEFTGGSIQEMIIVGVALADGLRRGSSS